MTTPDLKAIAALTESEKTLTLTIASAYCWLSGGYPAQAQDHLRNCLLAKEWKINEKFPWSYHEHPKATSPASQGLTEEERKRVDEIARSNKRAFAACAELNNSVAWYEDDIAYLRGIIDRLTAFPALMGKVTAPVQVKAHGATVPQEILTALAKQYAAYEPYHHSIDLTKLTPLDHAHQAAILLARAYLSNTAPQAPALKEVTREHVSQVAEALLMTTGTMLQGKDVVALQTILQNLLDRLLSASSSQAPVTEAYLAAHLYDLWDHAERSVAAHDGRCKMLARDLLNYYRITSLAPQDRDVGRGEGKEGK